MVDSITEDDLYRIEGEYIDRQKLSIDNIQAELDALGGFDEDAARAFATAAVRNRPSPSTTGLDGADDLAANGQMRVIGPAESGTDRNLAVTDAEGRTMGTTQNLQTWTDQWGNVMGKRKGADMTDARKVLDSDARGPGRE